MPDDVVCPRCQTRNPRIGRFCVSCGTPLDQQPKTEPRVEPPAVGHWATEKQVLQAQVPIADAVQIAAADPSPVRSDRVTCERCKGVCEGGMRFCKYCGAPIPAAQPPAGRGAVRREPRATENRGAPPTPSAVPPAPTVPAVRTAATAIKPAQVARRPIPTVARPSVPSASNPSVPNPSAPNPSAPKRPPRAPVQPRAAAPTRVEIPVQHAEQQLRTPAAPAVSYIAQSQRTTSPAPVAACGRLIVIGADGSEGQSFPLVGNQIDIGRTDGDVVIPNDVCMSPRHARLVQVDGNWFVRDLASTNGVYFRIREPHLLVDGDLLLLGEEVLRFEAAMDAELSLGPAVQHGTHVFGSPALPRPARLVQRTVEGVARDVYHLHRLETKIGRETGDIVFTDDPYMSRSHALIKRSTTLGPMTLVDLNSSNGSFVAVRGECALQGGDFIRIGQHLFRVELAPA